jgi:hypothetical protein
MGDIELLTVPESVTRRGLIIVSLILSSERLSVPWRQSVCVCSLVVDCMYCRVVISKLNERVGHSRRNEVFI